MVWVPGEEEKPISVSYSNGITVKGVGPTSRALLEREEGDWIGIRGPYGRGFEVIGKKPVLISGGCGIAPMAYLTEQLKKDYTIVMGAKSADELIFEERLKKHDLKVCTDDGSRGEKIFPHEVLKKLKGYDQIIACGPEPMLTAIMEIAKKRDVRAQVSLERFMKCGSGVCGSCAIDPSGLRVCKDGPVFWATELEGSELGKYRRNRSGSKQWY